MNIAGAPIEHSRRQSFAKWAFRVISVIAILAIGSIALTSIGTSGDDPSWDFFSTFLLVYALANFVFLLPVMFVLMGLSIWRAALEKHRKWQYWALASVLFVHNGFFLYAAIIWWRSGAPMP